MLLKPGRGAATRQSIVAAATRLFAQDGFDATSIDAVLAACGISKGALYHHFRNKEALFAAVLETVEVRIVEHADAASRDAATPADALRAGCEAWLALVVADEAVRRIAVIDAPAVLGWHGWRAMEDRYALGLLKAALAAAGTDPARTDLYASMLLAVLNETAMLVARAPDRAAAAQSARQAVGQVIAGLTGAVTD